MDEEPTATTLPTILCCMCGVPITPNPANMCVACIRSRVDITESIPKHSSIHYCKGCARFLQPPKNWVACELESKELLAICIKRLKGLSKVRLVDAGFRWTEPHSRRIHVRLVVQKEVFNNAILQQEFVVEFVVEHQQCDRCKRDAADLDQWQAVVQARQKVPHKRTFLYLEQLILKHNAHEDVLGIKTHPDGLDFYFLTKSQALKFLSFLHQVVPVKHKASDHLVSHDANSNVYRYKYSFSAEIVPLCKDDLLCLPPKICAALGGIGPLVVVSRVSQGLTVVDPNTMASAELSAIQFWKNPFPVLMNSKQTTEFVVLDIEPTGDESGKYAMADATVARSSDYGNNDKTYLIRTHLGRFLHPGDLTLGYDISTAVYNDAILEGHKAKSLDFPDVVLVKKTYSKQDRAKRRKWRLARLNMELDNTVGVAGSGKRGDRTVIDPATREAMDHEEFLQELEQDQELRSSVNLYKDPHAANHGTAVSAGTQENGGDSDPDDDYPEVPIEELLDGLVLEDADDRG